MRFPKDLSEKNIAVNNERRTASAIPQGALLYFTFLSYSKR